MARTPLRVNFVACLVAVVAIAATASASAVAVAATTAAASLLAHFILNFIYAIESCKFLFAF